MRFLTLGADIFLEFFNGSDKYGHKTLRNKGRQPIFDILTVTGSPDYLAFSSR